MNQNRLRIAALMSMPAALLALVAPLTELLPSHAFDKSWPVHARYHLTWAAGKLFALGVNQLLLIIFPFRAGQRWSWFALASNLLFGGLIIIPASRIQHGSIPPFEKHDRITKFSVLCVLLAILGLVISYGPIVGSGKSYDKR